MKRYKYTKQRMNADFMLVENSDGEWVKYEDIQKEFGDKCDCCGEYGRDRRTLWMGCGYDMSELSIPFVERKVDGITGFNAGGLFTLHVCKHCRGLWMTAIKEWFEQGRNDYD